MNQMTKTLISTPSCLTDAELFESIIRFVWEQGGDIRICSIAHAAVEMHRRAIAAGATPSSWYAEVVDSLASN